MKKSLPFVVTLLAGALSAYSQGQIEFDDYAHVPGDNFQITVWSPQVATPGTQLTGNGPSDYPAGTQTGYTGVPIGGGTTGSGAAGYGNGNNYSIALYYGVGANATTLSQLPGAIATFDTGGYAGSWDSAGGVLVSVPGIASGSTGTFQLNAWYNGGGTLTWAQAQAAGDPSGSSIAANITLAGPPNVPSTLNPITSFSLTSVPEPSTIALGVIGASAFLMRLRRKQ
jgi:hypothetical protein